MPNLSEQLLPNIDQFITGDRHQEEMLLWRLYRQEKLPEKDYFQVISHLNQRQDIASSKEEEARILVALALFKLLSPSGNERPAAIQHLETAIQQGNSLAICVMGYCYQHGIGVAKDPAKAVVLYQQAVDGGSATAANNLGICYALGIGVAKDPAKAVKFYQQAAVGGSAAAACSLGFCYQLGIGVAKDPVKAVELYQKAVDGGSDVAACNLGLCYDQGIGVAQDQVKAISLYISPINADETSEVSDTALKNLLSCLKSTPTLAPVDFAAVAKCCAIACKQFPQSEGCKTAKEILTLLAEKTKNFEVHYWAALILNPTIPGNFALRFYSNAKLLWNLIAKSPDDFVTCLIKDDVHSAQEKQAYFQFVFDRFNEKLSGRQELYVRNELGQLKELHLNQHSFFSLLPPQILSGFANGTLSGPPKEAEVKVPTPRF